MGKIIFVVGGARSGKSRYAVKLASQKGKKVAFIATCEALDDEMRKRIALHKRERLPDWKTFEEPRQVYSIIKGLKKGLDVILLDCATLLVSNLMMAGKSGRVIEGEADKIIKELRKKKSLSIVVSNEVGLGIVPDTKLGRDFRDIAGRVNQVIAAGSDEVIFMVSGIPWRIK